MEINRVGIIGAGQMGNGIAHVFALSGFDVILHDNSEVALSRALSVIDGNLERQVSKGPDIAPTIKNLHWSESGSPLSWREPAIPNWSLRQQPSGRKSSRRYSRSWFRICVRRRS